MLGNAIQHYWKLVVGRIYHIVPWLGGRMHCTEGEMFNENVELADRNQQVNAVRELMEEHRCWACIGLAREVGISGAPYIGGYNY